jgi:hypothetical protein
VRSPAKWIRYSGAIAVLILAWASPAAPQAYTPANPLFAGTSSSPQSSPAWFFASYPGYASGINGDYCKLLNNMITAVPAGSWIFWDIPGKLECALCRIEGIHVKAALFAGS